MVTIPTRFVWSQLLQKTSERRNDCSRATVLTFVPYYLPGYKAGGPIQSVANLVACLGDDLHFVIVTSDRDASDPEPYPGIAANAPQRVGNAEVFYLDRNQRRPDRLADLIRQVRADMYYLNSFFSRAFSLSVVLLRRFGMIPELPIILAPRGEFSPGALQIKAGRKRVFLNTSRALGMHKDLIWHATSPLEAGHIGATMDTVGGERRSKIVLAPIVDAPQQSPAYSDTTRPPPRMKAHGRVRLAYLSRITPKKNLLGALQILQGVQGQVEFNIFGPGDDTPYWRECQRAVKALPANVCAAYQGPVTHEQVPTVLGEHHILFLPTFGENYGHVIREALAVGTPVLISDQTPWRDLTAAGIGWDLPLERTDAFRAVIETCAAMDQVTFAQWSERAARYARENRADEQIIDHSRQLFSEALVAGRRSDQ